MDYDAIAKQYGAVNSAKPSVDYSALANKFGSISSKPASVSQANPQPQQDDGNPVINFAKSVISAPLTMLARPIQAGAELLGASDKDVNDISSKISGGLIAPTPQNYGDVGKDIGRAAQTVALGLGPISGGALFGAGNSLEQGNDLLSAQTAFQTALGAGGGKLLDFVGKPLLNAAGKVIGKITPDVLQDVASKGTQAIKNFADTHSLLPDNVSNIINKGADVAETIANKPFKAIGGATSGIRNSLSDRYYNQNVSDITKPTTIPEAKYNNATKIYNKAKSQGIDIGQEASDIGIKHQDLVQNGNYDTKDISQNIREDTGTLSNEKLRPALQKADIEATNANGGVTPRTSLNDIRDAALENASKDKTTDKADIIQDIKDHFNDKRQGSLRSDNPKGFNLEELHDNKIKFSKGVYNATKPAKNISEKYISDAFRKTLEKTAPKSIPVEEFNAELSKKYKVADYLESLHGKKAPVSFGQKIARTGAKVAGAIGGHALGGGLLGEVGGYHIGGFAENALENMSNPLKKYFLNDIEAATPKSFKKMDSYLKSPSTQSEVAQPINNAKSNIPMSKVKPISPAKSMSLTDIREAMRNPNLVKETPKMAKAFSKMRKLP